MTDFEKIAGGILACAKDEDELQQLKEFIADDKNTDFIEYAYYLANGFEGFATLSSGKVCHISQPKISAETTGKTFKKIYGKLETGKQISNKFVDKNKKFKPIPQILKELSEKWNEIEQNKI